MRTKTFTAMTRDSSESDSPVEEPSKNSADAAYFTPDAQETSSGGVSLRRYYSATLELN